MNGDSAGDGGLEAEALQVDGGDLGQVMDALQAPPESTLFAGRPEMAYRAALHGLVPVPPYRVTVGREGEFVAVPRHPRLLSEVGAALIAGDCHRRMLAGKAAGDGADPFADVRHGVWLGVWPGDVGRQVRTFPCPRCGLISAGPEDVRDGYCGACHERTAEVRADGGTVGGVRMAADSAASVWWDVNGSKVDPSC